MEKKGITLVALVVTIIILLILAAVTIGLILGDNSIFGRATSGRDKTALSQIGERFQSAGVAFLMDVQTGDYDIAEGTNNTAANVATRLKTYLNTDDAALVTTDGGTPSFTKDSATNKYTFTYTENGFTLTYILDVTANSSDFEITP